MDNEKPTVSFGEQGNEIRRRLWHQFVATLDVHQRRHFYRLLAPKSPKRIERALRNLLIVFEKVDKILAASEAAGRE
jgi:hypothetical protein